MGSIDLAQSKAGGICGLTQKNEISAEFVSEFTEVKLEVTYYGTRTLSFTERLMLFALNFCSDPDEICTEPMSLEAAKLGWILIRNRWISAAQLQAILSQQMQSQQKLGELLLSSALITEGQLKQALREQYWRRSGYWVI